VSLTLRAARRRELPEIYDLLERCFPEASREHFVQQTEHDSTFRFRHARVAEAGGRIVGYVRIFSRTMLVRGAPVAARGIGSVATLPDARRSGVATALLRDAIDRMRREETALSFLFTGIPGFYERLGYRTVREHWVEADGADAAAIPLPSLYRVRPITDGDVSRMLAIYRGATAGTTGAIARTRRSWRDAASWLGEVQADGFVAERDGVIVAYLRSRCRTYGHQILEAEHLHRHEGAISSLLAAAGALAAAHGEPLVTSVPAGHALGMALRTLPSSTVTTDVLYPMMMRIIDLDALLRALLPYLRARARTPGPPLHLELCAPDDQSVTLGVAGRTVTLRGGEADLRLDEAGTFAAVLGQRRASRLARPQPDAAVPRRIDALFPETPLHFWMCDRI
jgi:predicted N-acetyltransferase YhbS